MLHPSTISDVSFPSREYNLHLLSLTSRSSQKKIPKGQDQEAKNIFQYKPISHFKPGVHCKSLFKRREKKISGQQTMPRRRSNQNMVSKQKSKAKKVETEQDFKNHGVKL